MLNMLQSSEIFLRQSVKRWKTELAWSRPVAYLGFQLGGGEAPAAIGVEGGGV